VGKWNFYHFSLAPGSLFCYPGKSTIAPLWKKSFRRPCQHWSKLARAYFLPTRFRFSFSKQTPPCSRAGWWRSPPNTTTCPTSRSARRSGSSSASSPSCKCASGWATTARGDPARNVTSFGVETSRGRFENTVQSSCETSPPRLSGGVARTSPMP